MTDSQPRSSATPAQVVVQPFALPPAEVLSALDSSANGLSGPEAAQRHSRFGPNRLPEPERDPLWKRFLKHFDDILIYILLAAAVLKAIMGDWVDFWRHHGGRRASTRVIGFIQEGRAEKALAGIREMLSADAQCAARRRLGDGRRPRTSCPATSSGVRAGDRVPADVRLIQAVQPAVEESALTGESVPSSRSGRRRSPRMPASATAPRCCSPARSSPPARGAGVVTGDRRAGRDRPHPERCCRGRGRSTPR